ncbi:hypothetical protein AGLY_017713 [Aphis glycines]|uniref:Uncharacterized protein n=1 Tax=Aphis glycines TaxID=307491 RepID=A0A6G0SU55_APHGL|nr:hypothetical protein AGLY_017713 [Aphis glycines]
MPDAATIVHYTKLYYVAASFRVKDGSSHVCLSPGTQLPSDRIIGILFDARRCVDNAEAWEEADAGVADHQGPEEYFSEFNLLNHLDLEYFSNKKHLEIFRSFIFLTTTSIPYHIFQLLERGTLQIWRSRKFSGKIFIYYGGTFGNESLLKKTTAERQLQRLRKRKESTSNTTAQQSRRMDTSTQTIVRLTLVASPLELKTPSYKLLLLVKVPSAHGKTVLQRESQISCVSDCLVTLHM